jgi:hypothetical protein
MKTPCQRLLSLLLVFVLVLSLIPSVYAADNDESTPTEPEATETTASTESPTTTPPQILLKKQKAAPQAHLIPSLTMNTGLRQPPAHLQASCCLTMPTTATTQRC